jgi:hypothetical protein
MTENIQRLPVKTIGKLMAELSVLQDRVRSGERLELPLVTLWLSSGHSLCGRIMRLLPSTLSDPEATLLLQSRDLPMDLHYISIAAIQCVTVHYTDRSLPLLSDGKIRETAGRIPTRLDLERQARSISAQLPGIDVKILWDELPKSAAAFESLESLLTDLQAILAAICGDSLGLISLQERVTGIAVGVEAIAKVRLQAKILEVCVGIEAGDLVCQSKDLLQQAIEKLL